MPAAQAKNWKCCHCGRLFQVPADQHSGDQQPLPPTDATEPSTEEPELRSPAELPLVLTMLSQELQRQEESRSTCMMALGLFSLFAFMNGSNPFDYAMQFLDEE